MILNGNTFQNAERKAKGESALPLYILGKTGEALLLGGTGVGFAESAYTKFGPKGNDGLVKPALKKAYKALGGSLSEETDSGNPTDYSKNATGKNDDGKPTNSTNNEQKQSVQHSNSLNSDTNSVPKNGETRKFTSDAKLSKVADIGKGLGEGIIFGEVMSDAPKMSMNEGDYNLARAQAAPNNAFSGLDFGGYYNAIAIIF